MKVLLVAAVALLALQSGQAAHKRSVTKRLTNGGFLPTSLAAELNMEAGSSFREGERAMTAKGNERQRLRQTYGGLDVVGATADVEVTQQGVVTGTVSGVLAFSLDSDISDVNRCERSTETLMTRARQYLQDKFQLSVNDATPALNIRKQKKIHFEGDQGVAKLVYQLEFLVELEPTPCRPFFIIDACSPGLDVLIQFDKIHNMTLAVQKRQAEESCDTTSAPPATTTSSPTGACPATSPANGVGGNEKTGQTDYGINKPFCLNTQVSDSTCTFSSKYAVVIDLDFTTSASGRTALQFDCEAGHVDAINGAYGVANDAFYFGDSTGALYEQWYGLYALGYAPQLRIHYSRCYQNAFWNGRDMTFGDGCSSLYPLVSQDVVAHELGHGITDRYSDLYYAGQSGGINEAFSDMSGEVAELFSRNSNDWEVGRELFKGNQALRYFERPSRDGQSIDNAADYTNGLDVHYSSGVFNRAFYQLVEVQGVPLRQSYEIFLQANRVIWQETTNFQEGACGAMKAAYDLGYDVTKVSNAFSVVGIDLASCNYQSFSQFMGAGDARSAVSVSSLRNPVFALDVGAGATVVIDTVAEAAVKVMVYVTSDAAGSNVIAGGPTPFVLDVTADAAYFKLASSTDGDVSVDVTVEVVS